MIKILKEKDRALTLATPVVNTPYSTPVPKPATKTKTAPLVGALAPPSTLSSSSN